MDREDRNPTDWLVGILYVAALITVTVCSSILVSAFVPG